MKAASGAEIRETDRKTIEEYGIPGSVLMGLAGNAAVREIVSFFGSIKRAAVCAGTGNNGGDGFVTAYLLACRGISAVIYLLGSPDRMTPDAALYFNACRKAGIPVISVTEGTADFSGFDLIIDALCGTGISGGLRGLTAAMVKAVNSSGVPVASLDIPSGLPADGQAPEGPAVRAKLTVTMGWPKLSLVTWPGAGYCGTVKTVDIGFPSVLGESFASSLITEDFIQKISQKYDPDINKTDRGHLLIIGGFHGMEGAGLLAASGAFAAGAGLVTLACDGRARSVSAGKIPELMTADLDEQDPSDLVSSGRFRALVIGPGTGRTPEARNIFFKVMESMASGGIKRVLIDGDGLFHLAEYLKTGPLPEQVSFVLTPHFMEASRLTGQSVEEIRKDRIRAAELCADITGCSLILKGPLSVIACRKSPDRRRYINTTGNSLLATAGSGDVLSGITGAYLMTELSPEMALCKGAFVHGAAADLAAAEGRKHISASEIAGYLKKVNLL